MGELRFSSANKEQEQQAIKKSTTSMNLDFGVNKMMMMLHQNHHHRPFSSPSFDFDSHHGPTSFPHHHPPVNSASSSVSAIDGEPAIRPLQPFHYTPATTTPGGGKMAALGVPFTSAQWRELQRQAMIYKYMMASVPVPSDLLISTPTTFDGGFNLRLSSGTDPEPGRCKRTDGKKWRCSRDVAPSHKYCERHMHRGRPRSRKPVEVHTNTNTNTAINNNSNLQIKRARHDCNPFSSSGDVTVAVPSRKNGSPSHFLANSQPYLEKSSLSLDNFGLKAANFDSLASVSSNREPRGLEWMLNGDPISLGASDSGWHSLMHDNKVGSCNNTEPQYLNSFALYSSGLDHHDRSLPPFLNPLAVPMENLQSEKPRGFIDAWSNTGARESNANKNPASSTGKLTLSSLDLSMGGAGHEEMGTIGMGLGLMEPDGNPHNDTKISLSNWLNPSSPWVASSTPGGPLAEVLRPSTVTATSDAATSDPSSPAVTHVESSRTVVSSPSGVLQKAIASFSDSSSNSSPTVASSRSSSEFTMFKFNQV